MRKFAFLVIFAAAGLFLMPCAHAKKENASVAPAKAEALVKETADLAPDFKLPDLNGKYHILNEYRGKQPVLLFFWTTWCPFCRTEIKKISENKSNLAKSGIEVLAIDIGESKTRVKRFIDSNKIELKVLLDEDSATGNTYNVMGVPTFYVLNKQGKIVSEGNKFPEDCGKLILKK